MWLVPAILDSAEQNIPSQKLLSDSTALEFGLLTLNLAFSYRQRLLEIRFA